MPDQLEALPRESAALSDGVSPVSAAERLVIVDILAALPSTASSRSTSWCSRHRGALAARTPSAQQMLRPLAMTGRMALTNYLLQSVTCSVIFNGYGLGLVGKVTPTAAILLAVGIFAVQMGLSCWWLARFRFGPMEWLWRYLTYGRRPILLLSASG